MQSSAGAAVGGESTPQRVDLTKNAMSMNTENKLGEGASHIVNSGATYWFTGLSGAGKSTLSSAMKKKIDALVADNKKVFILDGDVIRQGLNKDLGFTPEARAENIRRISEVAKLFAMAGQICFVAFISPYAKDRDFARKIHAEAGLKFYECYINSSLDVCEKRDTKGLYKKAREGIIKNFTGVSDPYEAPENPELNVDTGNLDLESCQTFVLKHMMQEKVILDKSVSRVTQSLVQESNEAEAAHFKTLKTLDIDIHQAQYLQTIGDGWAYPLKGFMDESELLQCLQMKTISDEVGTRHLMPCPITQPVTTE